MKTSFSLILVSFFIWISFSAQTCTMVIVHGKDHATQPYKASFQSDRGSILAAAKKSLEDKGFQILTYEETPGKIVTGWRPVAADSHYFNLFGRKDYGVSDGAYYQLFVDLIDEGNQTKVLISTTTKNIVGKLESSGKIEKAVISDMEVLLQSPQIEMTNVGVSKKR